MSGHGVGNLWLLFCALFIFIPWSFPRKVACQSSKFGLADPREKETCLCLCGKQHEKWERAALSSSLTGTTSYSLGHTKVSSGRAVVEGATEDELTLRLPGSTGLGEGALSSLSAPPEHRQKSQALLSPVERHSGLG